MKFNKLAGVTKAVVGITSATGIGFIVGNVVAATTPPATKAIARFCINVGASSLSAMLATRATVFNDTVIDAIFTPPVEETKADTTEKDSE